MLILALLASLISDASAAVILPGPDLESRLQEALAVAVPGETIELPDGSHELHDELTLDKPGLHLKGQGMNRTILSFKKQKAGAQGISGIASGLVLEDFTVENTPGDGIKASGASSITFRRVRVRWTGPASEKNGGYGFYPVLSRDVLIEDCEVSGASDSGVYVGQSERIIVRRVYAHGNVAGIEIENSRYADVTENEVSGNTAGILVFDLPDLPNQGGRQTRVFKNHVHQNEHRNFSAKGNILNLVPPGVGILVLANDDTEIFGNLIQQHRLTGIAVAHFAVTGREVRDPNYDPKPERINIHDNVIVRQKHSFFDGSQMNFLFNVLFGFRIPDLIYDGIEDGTYSGTALPPERKVCARGNVDEDGKPSTFGNAHLDNQQKDVFWPGGPVTRDPAPHDCSLEAIPAVRLLPAPPLPPVFPAPDPAQVERVCKAGGSGPNWAALLLFDCPSLSDYRLFTDPSDPTGNPAEGGMPYALNTELFTDYATKHRLVFFPPRLSADYHASGVLEFPPGTVITKTFSYPGKLVETRLLIRRLYGWVALPYRWEGRDAALKLGGSIESLKVEAGGRKRKISYQIPGRSKCVGCHQGSTLFSTLQPIGPKAKFLNGDFHYETGIENQLQHWARAGRLRDLPTIPSEIPHVPPINDRPGATIENRAKGYLEINCAHCHNPTGKARNTGLYLEYERDARTTEYGFCKPPVAAGAGSGGKSFDVVPGQPHESILWLRMASAHVAVRMPELGRSLVHEEGKDLVHGWIQSSAPGPCSK